MVTETPTQPRKSPQAKRVTTPSMATFMRSIPHMAAQDQLDLLTALVDDMETRKALVLSNGDLAKNIRELL